MERTLLTDFRNYIANNTTVQAALGTAPIAGTNLFISFLPDSPDTCIAIYPSGGSESPTSTGKRHLDSVYVLIRAMDNDAAYRTGKTLITLLDDQTRSNQKILTNTIGIALVNQSQPTYVGRDDNLRSLYRVDVDFRIVRYESMTA
jgi:hypothetical protein